MYVCTQNACLVPAEARTRHWISWKWSYKRLSHRVDAGNLNIWKNSLCS